MKIGDEAIEWINGELLGDGCLQFTSPHSVRFNYGSKYLEYIEYVRNMINSFGISGEKIYKYRRTVSSYDHKYTSHSYKEMVSLRKKWYPKGKKIVPRDIKLTSLTCRQWYIGDGCLICRGKRNPHIIMYTDGFSVLDINLLLKKLTNLGFKVSRVIHNYSKWCIHISTYSTKAFLDYIGNCPVKCYEYKFDYKGIKNREKKEVN